jgi:amino acid transporter
MSHQHPLGEQIATYENPSPAYPEGYDKEKPSNVAGGDDIYVGEPVEPREEETHRSLKPRQISMIAIGGAIGESRGLGKTNRCSARPVILVAWWTYEVL